MSGLLAQEFGLTVPSYWVAAATMVVLSATRAIVVNNHRAVTEAMEEARL